MLKKLNAALVGLLLNAALWAQPAFASSIPLYTPSFSNGVLDTTNLNSAIAAVNNMTGNGTPQAGTFSTVTASGTVTANGMVTLNGQLIPAYGTPTIASGACGTTTNGTLASGSTNQAGEVIIASASTSTCTISFSATLGAAPLACSLTPGNAAAAAWGTTGAYVSSITTGHWVITGTLASTDFYYHCF